MSVSWPYEGVQLPKSLSTWVVVSPEVIELANRLNAALPARPRFGVSTGLVEMCWNRSTYSIRSGKLLVEKSLKFLLP